MLVYAEQVMTCVNPPVDIITVCCCNKCDWEAIQEDMMNPPWLSIEKYDDIDAAWNSWKLRFFEVLDKYAPVERFRPRKHHLPWIDDEIRELM